MVPGHGFDVLVARREFVVQKNVCFDVCAVGRGEDNIGAVMITYTILVVPYYNYRRMVPKTLFLLLRPLYYPKQ